MQTLQHPSPQRLRFRLSVAVLLLPVLLRGAVMINEIMYHPPSHLPAEEFIELHNNGSSPVNLGGWRFTSGVSFTFPNVSLPAGGFLVVAADGRAFAAKYPTVTNVVAGWTGRLSNSAESLVLRDGSGAVVDRVDYADDGDWALRERDDPDGAHRGWRWRSQADGYGQSLELINAAFDNNHGQNWGASRTAGGTPGAANSLAAADIAPVVSNVRHFPLIPKSTQAVTVHATVVDDRATAVTVTVSYRDDGATAWTTVPMYDDGAHDDGIAGDRIFGAQLPARPDDTIVEFYVTASDGRLARTWPAPAGNNPEPGAPFVAEQTQNCLYQVEDTTYAGALPLYRFVVRAVDRAELTDINLGNGSDSHARFNATFISLDGTGSELRYLTGLRNRGHGSAVQQPQSFHVSIPNAWTWKGRTGLNLNSQFSYLQLLGSAFLRQAGLVAAESRQVQLRLNNVDPTGGSARRPSYGSYVCNEFLDTDFARRHFPTDDGGNLYSVHRTDWGPYQEGDFTHLPPAGLNGADPYRPVYFKDTNAVEDNWNDLITLTQALAKGRFTTLLNPPSWDPDYVTAVRAKVDVDQWMRWLAAQMLIGNGETQLANGYGDDFAFYIGINDPRARLIPYDLDTVLGDGDAPSAPTEDIFPMIVHAADKVPPLTPTVFYPLLRHPDFAPTYFTRLQELLRGTLSVASFNSLADQTLSGVVSAGLIAERKAWYAARHAHVSGLVFLPLAVTRGPAVDAAGGYPRSTTPTSRLAGTADPARTHRVTVNGAAANYAPWRVATTTASSNTFTVVIGEWSLDDVALQPGINRVRIQAFAANGEEIGQTTYEVWHDTGAGTRVSGALAADTTWTAEGGPYRIASGVTIGSGVTLTIAAGTTLYLEADAGLTVAPGGRLLAEGTAAKPIHFTRPPGATSPGGTITLQGAAGAPETRLAHVFFNHGGSPAVLCSANANVVFESCEWLRNDVPYLHLNGASFLVSNCIFPTAREGAFFEAITGKGRAPAGGRAIIRGCFFGKCHSAVGNYNDVVDLTGDNRPGPILQFYDNVFAGSDDDLLDLDGTDAWIEGNLFLHVHRVNSPDSASAVSGGNDGDQTSEITIVGNLFYDVDQAATAKEGNFFTFLYNTVVDQNSRGSEERLEDIVGHPEIYLPAVLNLADHRTPAARGIYAEGNVIHSAERLVRNFTGRELVTFNRNLLPPGVAWNGPGTGNVSAPALLNDVTLDATTGAANIPTPTKDNYRSVGQKIRRQFGLDPRSPARGLGPHRTDAGGVRPPGVSLGGAPEGTTHVTSATINVGVLLTGFGIPDGPAQFPLGSGWTHYRWRLDGGDWSAETPTTTPITLAGLADGPHTLEVAGKNDAGTYQDSPDLGSYGQPSRASWTVNTGQIPAGAGPLVRINEVLASNTETLRVGTAYPDLIELTNVGGAVADLGGWGLSDNAALPYKYTFPAGTTLAPGAFLVIPASSSGAVPAPRTGFALGASGDDLTLTRSTAAGGGTVDRVVWGAQLNDFSIGRAADGSWMLCLPTFGAPNVPAAQSAAGAVRINEWLAEAATLFSADFIELYNPGQHPVDLGGHFLTDNPVGWPKRSPLRPLTFIPAGGFLVFQADGDAGAGQVDFRLSPVQGEIGLVSPAQVLIDHVVYGPQRTDVSQGRAPDGAVALLPFPQPTPGAPNPQGAAAASTTLNIVLTPDVIPASKTWRYYAHPSAAPAPDAAGRAFTHPLYDDSAWPAAPAGFYVGTTPFPANNEGFVRTTVLPGHDADSPYQTYYFRTHFAYLGPLPDGAMTIELRARVLCDDGAVFHLNGQPLTPRLRVASGPVGFENEAESLAPTATIESIVLSSAGLIQGDNVLTVSVHQFGKQSATTGSSDLAWAMRLDLAAVSTDTTVALRTPVVLNEVLVVNGSPPGPDGTAAGWIELLNTGAAAYDLGDFSLTDVVGLPRKYVFEPGTVLPAGGRLVLDCNPRAALGPANTGFNLRPEGGRLFLFVSPALGGSLGDSLAFGQQVPDYSLARIPDGRGPFALGVPTRDALNAAAATASVAEVRINEWATNPAGNGPTWFELFNPGPLPVLLGDNYLTDRLTNKTKFRIPPLTYLGGTGASRWLQIVADNDAGPTPNHVNFTLVAGEGIGLFTAAGTLIDSVTTSAPAAGATQGRFGDGAGSLASLTPTPGAPNRRLLPDTDGDGMPDAWEIAQGFDPLNPADAHLDADGDGQSNLAEFLAGTDPRNPRDFVVPPPPRTATRLLNLSILATLETGEQMTLGVAIGGAGTSGPKALVTRAAGPSLAQFGVAEFLPDPRLSLVRQDSGATVAANNDWGGDSALSTAFAQVGAFPFSSPASRDAGVTQPALPAANYTVQVNDTATGAGGVLAEVYDATPAGAQTASTPRLINLSVLKRLGPGATLTAGFVLDGSGSRTVLARAVGPTLGSPPFNLSGTLANPKLELFHNGTGALLAGNDDWAGTPALAAAFNAVGAFPLAAATTRDAALLATLAPGQYSVRIGGSTGDSGLVLVEIYEVP